MGNRTESSSIPLQPTARPSRLTEHQGLILGRLNMFSVGLPLLLTAMQLLILFHAEKLL